MAAPGASCLSGKEMQGEIPEEIAQLVAEVSGPHWEQLLGAVAVGKWLLQEPGTLSCHPKGALHGHWLLRGTWVREPQVLRGCCGYAPVRVSPLGGPWHGLRQLLSAWKWLRADFGGKNLSGQGSCLA